MAGSIAGAVAGGLASKAAGKLLGGKGGGSVDIPMSAQMASPIRLDSNYYQLAPNGDRNFSFNRNPIIDAWLDESRNLRRGAGAAIGGLLDQVRPGMGALTDARVRSVRDARDASVSNLRDNLARHRVLGSSFGQDAVSRTDAEFAKLEGEERARSFLEELDLTSRLIQEQTGYLTSAAELGINQANLEFQLATSLINGTQQVLQSNANAIADLAAQNAAGAGAFSDRVGSGVSSWLEKQDWWPF